MLTGEKGRKGEGRIKLRKHSQEIANQGKMEVGEEQQSPLLLKGKAKGSRLAFKEEALKFPAQVSSASLPIRILQDTVCCSQAWLSGSPAKFPIIF